MQNRLLFFLFLFLWHPLIYAQIIGLQKLHSLIDHSHFEWIIDTMDTNVFLYYEKDSYADNTRTTLQEGIRDCINNTLLFIEVEKYEKPIHYFLIGSRQKMKQLVGWQTNGTTHYKQNYIVAIHTERNKIAFLNHELFHLLAMNEWGKTERWINEGMAVYSDRFINGYPLHQLSKYIIDHNQFISLGKMAKGLRKYDSQITYPLLGSFMEYIEETYGRETTKTMWDAGRRQFIPQVGKSLEELEMEWLEMLASVVYSDIKYLK